jgi:two-component system alkaline phosphatase synthesis response regulator PhoP
MGCKILIIEDEEDIVRGLTDNLEMEGYEVISSTNGEEGIKLAINEAPSLIILDLMLPDMDGIDVIKSLKRDIPVIILTAKTQEIDKVLGLEMGADDYITKPFSVRELLSRIKAVLRRNKLIFKEDIFRFSDIEINFREHRVNKRNKRIPFTSKEFRIMKLLIENMGKVVSKENFLKEIWGYRGSVETRSLDNYISRIRKKIEKDLKNPKHIITVYGEGYIFFP